MTVEYLGLVDVCNAAGYGWQRVHGWIKNTDDFPEPDVTISRRNRAPYRGWQPSRLPELIEWLRRHESTLDPRFSKPKAPRIPTTSPVVSE